jgi:hypothetical protein
MTALAELASLPALAIIAPTMTPAEAHKVALANYFLARKAEDLATMAVWEADLGKDADAARVIYRKMTQTRREVEAVLEAIVKTM